MWKLKTYKKETRNLTNISETIDFSLEIGKYKQHTLFSPFM